VLEKTAAAADHPLLIDRIENVLPLPAGAHAAASFQYTQVVRDVGLGQLHPRRDLPHRKLPPLQQLEDLLPGGVGNGFKKQQTTFYHINNRLYVTKTCIICQALLDQPSETAAGIPPFLVPQASPLVNQLKLKIIP